MEGFFALLRSGIMTVVSVRFFVMRRAELFGATKSHFGGQDIARRSWYTKADYGVHKRPLLVRIPSREFIPLSVCNMQCNVIARFFARCL